MLLDEVVGLRRGVPALELLCPEKLSAVLAPRGRCTVRRPGLSAVDGVAANGLSEMVPRILVGVCSIALAAAFSSISWRI